MKYVFNVGGKNSGGPGRKLIELLQVHILPFVISPPNMPIKFEE